MNECLARSSSGIGSLLASHDGNWKSSFVDLVIIGVISVWEFVSRPSSCIPESFDVVTFLIDCFWFNELVGFKSDFLILLLSRFIDERLLDNDIRSDSPITVSGDGFSPSYGAVQQRQATRQRTILKCAS